MNTAKTITKEKRKKRKHTDIMILLGSVFLLVSSEEEVKKYWKELRRKIEEVAKENNIDISLDYEIEERSSVLWQILFYIRVYGDPDDNPKSLKEKVKHFLLHNLRKIYQETSLRTFGNPLFYSESVWREVLSELSEDKIKEFKQELEKELESYAEFLSMLLGGIYTFKAKILQATRPVLLSEESVAELLVSDLLLLVNALNKVKRTDIIITRSYNAKKAIEAAVEDEALLIEQVTPVSDEGIVVWDITKLKNTGKAYLLAIEALYSDIAYLDVLHTFLLAFKRRIYDIESQTDNLMRDDNESTRLSIKEIIELLKNAIYYIENRFSTLEELIVTAYMNGRQSLTEFERVMVSYGYYPKEISEAVVVLRAKLESLKDSFEILRGPKERIERKIKDFYHYLLQLDPELLTKMREVSLNNKLYYHDEEVQKVFEVGFGISLDDIPIPILHGIVRAGFNFYLKFKKSWESYRNGLKGGE